MDRNTGITVCSHQPLVALSYTCAPVDTFSLIDPVRYSRSLGLSVWKACVLSKLDGMRDGRRWWQICNARRPRRFVYYSSESRDFENMSMNVGMRGRGDSPRRQYQGLRKLVVAEESFSLKINPPGQLFGPGGPSSPTITGWAANRGNSAAELVCLRRVGACPANGLHYLHQLGLVCKTHLPVCLRLPTWISPVIPGPRWFCQFCMS